MPNKKNLVYIVEGETEKKLLETLKTNFQCICPGKIIILNAVQKLFARNRFMPYDKSHFVILFDTDVEFINILKENIKMLSDLSNSKAVYCIPQVKNLEDELCYACNIKNIRQLTGSSSASDFKRDFLRISNSTLHQKLISNGFDFARLWCRKSTGIFSSITNDAEKIKLKKY